MYNFVAYYPEHWPEAQWAEDARLMVEANFDGARVGEFAWCRLEPEEDRFDFDWLDRAIETLAAAGLRVLLGTPTATPPAWLVHAHPEILPVDARGVRMSFGMRKHYCHTSPVYREYAGRITAALAERYGAHPAVMGWQLDNEFGDHDTTRCYCDACREAFIGWLRARYPSLAALNAAWGTVFWSQEYSAWEQLPLPAPRRPIGLNPSHLLDYYRFASDQVLDFARQQAEILRARIAPEQALTTNLAVTYWEIDFRKLAEPLDFIGWDCYPFIDALSPIRYPPDAPPPPLHLPPRPAMTALVHDLVRSFKERPFWVLETAGQDRVVTYQTLAHGGEGISFFRWRGPRFGAEQARGGYVYHGIRGPRFAEGQRLGAELRTLAPQLAETRFKAAVGLLYDFDMAWAYDIAYVYPRSTWLDRRGYWRLLEEVYTHFWQRNVPLALLHREDDWSTYPALVIPSLYLVTPELSDKLCDYVAQGGVLIAGPGSGVKDWHNVFAAELPPLGKLRELFGCALVGEGSWFDLRPLTVQLTAAAPFAPGQRVTGPAGLTQDGGIFGSSPACEALQPEGAAVWARFVETSVPALTANAYGAGLALYLAWLPAADFWQAFIDWLLATGKAFAALETSPGVEATLRTGPAGNVLFLINHNFASATVALPRAYRDLLTGEVVSGGLELPPQSARVLGAVGGSSEIYFASSATHVD